MANKYLNIDGVAYLWEKIKNALSGKVDKETGKGLSSNDFTAEEKAKLANIQAGAEVNVNADWNAVTGDAAILNKPTIPTKTSDLTNDSGFVDSSDLPEAATVAPLMDGTAAVGTSAKYAREDHRHPSDTTKVSTRVVDTTISTASSQVVNDGYEAELIAQDTSQNTRSSVDVAPDHVQLSSSIGSYSGSIHIDNSGDITITSGSNTTIISSLGTEIHNIVAPTANGDAANKKYVDDAVAGVTGVDFRVVTSLPAAGESGVIYLVSNGGSSPNSYDEYIWISSTGSYEKIGTTDIDLSDYMMKSDMVAITNAEIDVIVAA